MSGPPGATSPLLWKPSPNNFTFQDDNLNAFAVGQDSGLITITAPGPTPTATPLGTPTPTPIATPMVTPTATPVLIPVDVSLPIAGFNPAVPIGAVIVQPVVTTNIDASSKYIGFQGDFTFDSSVVDFSSPFVEAAGLTATGNWHVAGTILPGSGSIRTFRLSFYSNDFVPLSGSGTFFNLRMLRVSGTPGATSPLVWQFGPNSFFFEDADLNTFTPSQEEWTHHHHRAYGNADARADRNANSGTTATPSPAPTATPPPGSAYVSLPTADFDPSIPSSTVIIQPVVTTNIDSSSNFIGFQGDFTFDSSVVDFSSPFVEAAGLTSTGSWHVAGHALPGSGPIRTFRLSFSSNDFVPLFGSGTLFNLRMLRVSSAPGATSPLVWRSTPNNFVFVDADLNTFTPGQNNGLITITAPTPPPMVSISGTVSYCSSSSPDPMADVTLTLAGSSGGATLSDGSGNYQFLSLPGGGSYTVTPAKAAVAPGSPGINTVDVVAIQRHFLQISLLTGCRLVAANVNGDNTVNTVDALAIRQFYFGHPSANVGTYLFTPASRAYPSAVSDQTGQNYDVLILGDVASPFADRPNSRSQDATDD